MSIQIPSSASKNENLCLFAFALREFSVTPPFLIASTICQYFLPFWGIFAFFRMSFEAQSLNVDKVQYIFFSFVFMLLVLCLRKHGQILGREDLSLCFLLRASLYFGL